MKQTKPQSQFQPIWLPVPRLSGKPGDRYPVSTQSRSHAFSSVTGDLSVHNQAGVNFSVTLTDVGPLDQLTPCWPLFLPSPSSGHPLPPIHLTTQNCFFHYAIVIPKSKIDTHKRVKCEGWLFFYKMWFRVVWRPLCALIVSHHCWLAIGSENYRWQACTPSPAMKHC